MPFVHGLGKRVGDSGPDPDQSRLLDAELGSNLIGSDKADATDVAGQAVRVLRDQLNGVGTVGLVDPHRPRGTDPVAVQEQHDLTDDLLLGPAGDNLPGPLWADAGNLAKSRGLLLDDLKHLLAKDAHELSGIDRADAADHARAQILLDPLDCCGRRDLEEGSPELDTMDAVIDPATARLNKLAGRNRRCMPQHCDQVALATRLDAQYAKPVLLVMERHPLDEAGQDLCHRARLCSLQHAHAL